MRQGLALYSEYTLTGEAPRQRGSVFMLAVGLVMQLMQILNERVAIMAISCAKEHLCDSLKIVFRIREALFQPDQADQLSHWSHPREVAS